MRLFASKSWLGLCVLLGSLSLTSAIFEEQLGEFDWKRENIGLVDASFVIRDELIVATADGVLACLDSDSGVAKWRVVLPQQSHVVKFLEADGQLVTLVSSLTTASLDAGASSMKVKAWSVSDGSLLWDTFLGSTVAGTSGEAVDVMFDTASKQITVIFDNALHFVSIPTSQSAAPAYWSWSASTDLSATPATLGSSGEAFATDRPELTLTLSSLVAPTYSPEQSQSGKADKAASRRAVGCFARAASAVCDGEVVVVKVGRNGVALDVFTAFPDNSRVLAVDLRAAVASEADLTYQTNDVVFAAVGGGRALAVLGLSSLQLVADFPLQGGEQDVVKTFVYVDSDGELRPAASVCTRTACQSVVAVAPTSSSSSSWVAQRLDGGKADCEGGDVRLQFASYQFFDRVVRSVSCLSVSSEDARLGTIALKAGGFAPAKAAADLAPLNVIVPPFHQPASAVQAQHFLNQNTKSAVHHLAYLPAKAGAKCTEHKLLAVLHSGHTLLLGLPCSSSPATSHVAAAGGVRWSRLEGLARAQQAVVLDRAAESSSAQGSGGDSVMPSFAERLNLQRAKVLVSVNGGLLLTLLSSLLTSDLVIS